MFAKITLRQVRVNMLHKKTGNLLSHIPGGFKKTDRA
jgi:hypothetical protein